MEINIIIDQITQCLKSNKTQQFVNTRYSQLHDTPTNKNWLFDWKHEKSLGHEIYELYVEKNQRSEGRISIEKCTGYIEVHLVEAANHNIGHKGEYLGVGGHLFAIACKISKEEGNNGVVAFTAKTNLVNHYKATLSAISISKQRMFIDERAARSLINTYFPKR